MAEPSHIVYAIPLRDGVIVRIHGLPDDLTKREAERVAAVVVALGSHPMTWPAVDGEPEYESWLPVGVPEVPPCDMGELCIGCTPRNPDGSCPGAGPAGVTASEDQTK